MMSQAAILNWCRSLGPFPRRPRTGWTYLLLRVVLLVVALVLIVLVYATKERGIITGPPIGLIAGGVTWYFLGDTRVQPSRRLLLSAAVGLVLAELTWAIGYWSVLPFVGAAGLWLSLYVLSGIVEHGAALTLDRRVTLEYAGVALAGCLVVLAIAHPWSP